MSKQKIYLSLVILILTTLACNLTAPQAQPTSAPIQVPQTEAGVPRISVEDAKSALDSGEAIIVDVRGAEFFAQGHIAGAVNIPLKNIEIDPAGVNLDKNQWIITYCT